MLVDDVPGVGLGIILEANVLEVAGISENAVVVGTNRLQRGRFGGFGGCQARRRARTGRDEVVNGSLVEHHLRIVVSQDMLCLQRDVDRGERATVV